MCPLRTLSDSSGSCMSNAISAPGDARTEHPTQVSKEEQCQVLQQDCYTPPSPPRPQCRNCVGYTAITPSLVGHSEEEGVYVLDKKGEAEL